MGSGPKGPLYPIAGFVGLKPHASTLNRFFAGERFPQKLGCIFMHRDVFLYMAGLVAPAIDFWDEKRTSQCDPGSVE